jgi:hypothetical protein
MGQVALGFRSLAIKGAVFFALAALLVWILGGKLFPRPEIADAAGVQFAGREWFWRLAVGGDRPGSAVWSLMTVEKDGPAPVDQRIWSDVAGPIVAGDELLYAGRVAGERQASWLLVRRDDRGQITDVPMPDRLAVEQQFERLRHGLPLQDEPTILRQREAVLDPAWESRPNGGGG